MDENSVRTQNACVFNFGKCCVYTMLMLYPVCMYSVYNTNTRIVCVNPTSLHSVFRMWSVSDLIVFVEILKVFVGNICFFSVAYSVSNSIKLIEVSFLLSILMELYVQSVQCTKCCSCRWVVTLISSIRHFTRMFALSALHARGIILPLLEKYDW